MDPARPGRVACGPTGCLRSTLFTLKRLVSTPPTPRYPVTRTVFSSGTGADRGLARLTGLQSRLHAVTPHVLDSFPDTLESVGSSPVAACDICHVLEGSLMSQPSLPSTLVVPLLEEEEGGFSRASWVHSTSALHGTGSTWHLLLGAVSPPGPVN